MNQCTTVCIYMHYQCIMYVCAHFFTFGTNLKSDRSILRFLFVPNSVTTSKWSEFLFSKYQAECVGDDEDVNVDHDNDDRSYLVYTPATPNTPDGAFRFLIDVYISIQERRCCEHIRISCLFPLECSRFEML